MMEMILPTADTNSDTSEMARGEMKGVVKKIGQFEKEEEETESTVLQGDLFKEIYVVRMKIKE